MYFLIYKVELTVNKILIILSLVLLASCGQSQDEKENIAAVACAIMVETRNMDAAVRVREMNEAREKIGGEPFLDGDDAITEAFEYGLCQELVLNENYDDILQHKEEAKREMERIAVEEYLEEQRIAAEKQKIADNKFAVKEELHSNGNLKSRTNYHPKIDGGKRHGPHVVYYENGQLELKRNYKDGKIDGLEEWYYENGQLLSKSCLINDNEVDMSYCEK